MSHVAEGFRIVLGNPRLWRYIALPLFYSALLFVAVVFVGYFLLVPPMTGWFGQLGMNPGASTLVGTLLYGTVWVLVGGIVYTSLASFLSSLLWDRLSLEVERLLDAPLVMDRTPPTSVIVADSARRTVFSLAMAAVGLCASAIPVAGPIAIAGIVGTLDYTAPAYIRRGVLFPEQRRQVTRLPGWFGFYVIAGVVSLIPLVNLFLLPAMVASGTVMVVRSERQ